MSFRDAVHQLGRRLRQQQGTQDLEHLQRIVAVTDVLGVVGFLTVGRDPNVWTVGALSLYTFSRWTMLAHHHCHGGYERLTGRNRRTYATGFKNRAREWLDWMLPEAWNLEHNRKHHYCLNETTDPDLVQQNMRPLRKSKVPLFLKRIQIAMTALAWKWVYYAPNSYKAWKVGNGPDPYEGRAVRIWDAFKAPLSRWEFAVRVAGPYFVWRFVTVPVLAEWTVGGGWNALLNVATAEALTNVHSFIVIVPNHCGADLYRFDGPTEADSEEFYRRQVLGSANFDTGRRGTLLGEVNDFLHGYLNYQIEHHMWPDLTMLSYQKAQPLLSEICHEHGLPYVQQSVWKRLLKTVRIMEGSESQELFESDQSGISPRQSTHD